MIIGALLTASFSTTLAHLATQWSGRPQRLQSLALLNAAFWLGWATLSLPLVMLARRVRIDRRPRVAVPVHLAALIVAAMLHIALQTFAQTVVWRFSMNMKMPMATAPDLSEWMGQWMGTFPVQLVLFLDWELFVGAGIIASAHAMFYYRESRERGMA